MDTRNSNRPGIRRIALAALVLFVTACGGGGGAGEQTADAAPPGTSTTAASPATLSISWMNLSSQPQSRVTSLTVWVTMTASGIRQVDFFIDGLLLGTSAAGGKQPGVPVAAYSMNWNTAAYSDGPHSVMARVTDNANLSAETSPRVVTLENSISIPLALSPHEIFPTPLSLATGDGQLSVNLATGAIAGSIKLTEMTASAVHLHAGSPTVSGASVVDLAFDSTTRHWTVPPGTTLTSAGSFSQVNELLAGGLYVDAHSVAHPDGEVRAQMLLKTMSLAFGMLSGDQEVPPVSSPGSGIVSIFEDRSTQRFQINGRTAGLSNVVSIGVYSRPGPASMSAWLFFLRPDANGNLVVSGSTAVTPGYNTGTWYMNVTTGKYPSGEKGGLLPVIDRLNVEVLNL